MVTFSDLDAIAEVMSDAIAAATAPLVARIAALEGRPEVKYMGAFQADFGCYNEASLVTKGGGLWISLRATTQTPGQSGDWRLDRQVWGRDVIEGEPFVRLPNGVRVHLVAVTLVDELLALGHQPCVGEDGDLRITRYADLPEDVRYVIETVTDDILEVLASGFGTIH